MSQAILFTQCLQRDFVKLISRNDPLPNLLHVGYDEARRLMGEGFSESPVVRIMKWAYNQSQDDLIIIHIRDWHAADDVQQKKHLQQFGEHCIAETKGAAFVFPHSEKDHDRVHIINALTLNDFLDTPLNNLLKSFQGQTVQVGIMGVWTEAKVTFLAYELGSRYPQFQIAVCSALTASSSRAQHFIALDQMQKILGVKVIASVGDFIQFLGGKAHALSLDNYNTKNPILQIEEDSYTPADKHLLKYLFRDCKRLEVKKLTGGFSGNIVLGTRSIDIMGHEQAPHVVKIGPRDLIGKERINFERIEDVLGNSAPRITEFADLGERGALKYRYASMGGWFLNNFSIPLLSRLPSEKNSGNFNFCF